MPTYRFRNKDNGAEWDEFMSMSEREDYLAENPNIEQCPPSNVNLGDPFLLGRMKPSSDFRDRLKEIKKTHKGSTINTL